MRVFGFSAFILFAILLAGSQAALADQAGDGSPASNSPTTSNPTTRQNDPRLPPVMPGEEIVTETGQKMRVWSSAGPVPVNPQPTAQQFNNGYGGGIIIDGRDFAGIDRREPRLGEGLGR